MIDTLKDKKGMLSLVLHTHLPFVRHPEHEKFLEEAWLFEAISETYLPLLRVFGRLEADAVPFRLTVSVSPTLAHMLQDELLMQRYVDHLSMLLELGSRELERNRQDAEVLKLARMYYDFYSLNLKEFEEVYERNILKKFRYYQDNGYLELITTCATHSFLPHYQSCPEMIRAQIMTGVESHDRVFSKMPSGIWLPECGYFPGVEEYLRNNGIKYFISSAHGMLYAEDRPVYGVYAPIKCPNGVAAFARDRSSSRAVWSATDGYPGDPVYRDFYRDIGFDLPLDYIGPYINDGVNRVNTGFKYHAITGITDQKKYYDPVAAKAKAYEHARLFVDNRVNQCETLGQYMDRPPVISAPYDAELFGHWWFEGPDFLEAVIREVASRNSELALVSPMDYLAAYPENQTTQPAFASWGDKGYGQVWLDGSNDWIYRHTHKLIERMQELVERFPDEKGLKERTLNQAAREVLLSQASDWPFIMKAGTMVPYARKSIKTHIHNFNYIYDSLSRNTIKTEWLTRLEKKDNIFPFLDYRIFKKE